MRRFASPTKNCSQHAETNAFQIINDGKDVELYFDPGTGPGKFGAALALDVPDTSDPESNQVDPSATLSDFQPQRQWGAREEPGEEGSADGTP